MGLPARSDYQEASNLKLAAEHFPISCSLRKQLEGDIAKGSRKGNDPVMPVEDLLEYLKKPADLDLTPYADLLNQTEAMGDPALPSWEHTVILRWFGEAWHFYEQRFPLEEPLKSSIRRLKPLAATFAIVDPDFMQPDVHPLHQLLDGIQERAVGWQASLGRAGANLERQISTAIDDALRWFDDKDTDLSEICSEFLQAAERDIDRAQRMSQRVIDTELGKQKTANAKRTAAEMINTLLQKHDAPTELGSFIKGPWYESAQLLLLKFGEGSDEWRKMCRTTEILLDSMRSLEGVEEDRRQHVFSVVTKLPKEMRRWLLSLHHDTDAVNDALDSIESLHVRLLKNEDITYTRHAPIPTVVRDSVDADSPLIKAMSPLRESQWFAIRNFKGSTIRVQLVLKNEAAQRMVFTNMAGIAVAHYSFEEFDQIMGKKNVTALPAKGGFSLCLTLASGIDTTEKLNALYATIAGVDPVPQVEDGAEPPADAEQPRQSPGDNTSGLAGTAAPAGDTAASSGSEGAAETGEELTAEFLDAMLSADPPDEPEPGPAEKTPEAPAASASSATAPRQDDTHKAPPAASVDDEQQDGWLTDMAAEEAPASSSEDFLGDLDAPTEVDDPLDFLFEDSTAQPVDDTSGDSTEGTYFGTAGDEKAVRSEPEPEADSARPSTADTSDADASQARTTTAATGRGDSEARVETVADIGYFGAVQSDNDRAGGSEQFLGEEQPAKPSSTAPASGATAPPHLDLPMGVWLGFHDGEMPMMAKLAVHDPSSDIYIFVNRNGIKLRELSGADLDQLLQDGMAEVLQTRSN